MVRIFPHLDWMWRDTEYLSYSVRMLKNADQNNSEYGHFYANKTKDLHKEEYQLLNEVFH